MHDKSTIGFYKWIFFTALLPYADRFFPIFPDGLLGFNLSGFAWLTILVVSLIRVIVHGRKIALPGWLWLPWISYIILQWLQDQSFLGLQSTLQYMVFPITGMAASTYSYSDETMVELRRWFGWYMGVVLVTMLMALADFGDFGKGVGSVMTLAVLGTILLSDFWLYGNRKMLLLFGVAAVIPVLAMVRMGIAMIFAVTVFHFANRNIASRLLILALAACAGVGVFYSPGFQRKTFYSGQGDLTHFSFSNEDVNSSGRKRMWELAERDMKDHPWLGAGSRADLKMLIKNGYKLKELHNDFIAVRYNSGWVGLGCLLFGFIGQFVSLYRLKGQVDDAFTALVYYSALTIFIAWIGFMYTDNALKYSPFFGNLHFCLIGIVYSRLAGTEPAKTLAHDIGHHSLV